LLFQLILSFKPFYCISQRNLVGIPGDFEDFRYFLTIWVLGARRETDLSRFAGIRFVFAEEAAERWIASSRSLAPRRRGLLTKTA